MSVPSFSIESKQTFLEKLKNNKVIIAGVLGLIVLGVVGYILYIKLYKKKNPVDCKLSDNWDWDSCNCGNPDSNKMGYTIGHRNILQQGSDGGKACPDPTSDELFQRKLCSCGSGLPITTPPGTTITTMPPGTTITTMPPETTITTMPPETTITTMPPETTITTMPPETTITTMPPTPLTSFPNDGDIIIIELVNSSLPSNIFLYSPDNTNLTGSSTPSAFKVIKSGNGFLFNLVGSNRYLTTRNFSTNGILSENAGVYNIIKEVYFKIAREQIDYPYPLPFGLMYDNKPVLDFKFWKLNN
jgi:hypothetical protein